MKNEMSAILVIGREIFEIYFHKYLDDIWGSFCQIYDLRAAQTESEFVEATAVASIESESHSNRA